MTREASDGGLSLIELIIVVVLIGILGVTIGTIFANSWIAQKDVMTTSTATNNGQIVAQGIERALRNAQAVDVTIDGTPSTDGTGNLLRVHTSQPGQKACQAFWFSGGSVYMAHGAGALPTPVVTSWPKAWSSQVAQHSGAAYFAQSGANVTYSFDIKTNAAPVSFVGRAAMRTVATGVTSPCW